MKEKYLVNHPLPATKVGYAGGNNEFVNKRPDHLVLRNLQSKIQSSVLHDSYASSVQRSMRQRRTDHNELIQAKFDPGQDFGNFFSLFRKDPDIQFLIPGGHSEDPYNSAKQYIDGIPKRKLRRLRARTVRETAKKASVQTILVNAMAKFNETAGFGIYQHLTTKEGLGVEGGCEQVSTVLSYLLNKIHGRQVTDYGPLVGGTNHHFGVRELDGGGQPVALIDATYRQFTGRLFGLTAAQQRALPMVLTSDGIPTDQDEVDNVIRDYYGNLNLN